MNFELENEKRRIKRKFIGEQVLLWLLCGVCIWVLYDASFLLFSLFLIFCLALVAIVYTLLSIQAYKEDIQCAELEFKRRREWARIYQSIVWCQEIVRQGDKLKRLCKKSQIF